VIGGVEHPQIPRDAGVYLFDPQTDRAGRVILVAGIYRLEPATTRALRLTPVCGCLTAYHI